MSPVGEQLITRAVSEQVTGEREPKSESNSPGESELAKIQQEGFARYLRMVFFCNRLAAHAWF